MERSRRLEWWGKARCRSHLSTLVRFFLFFPTTPPLSSHDMLGDVIVMGQCVLCCLPSYLITSVAAMWHARFFGVGRLWLVSSQLLQLDDFLSRFTASVLLDAPRLAILGLRRWDTAQRAAACLNSVLCRVRRSRDMRQKNVQRSVLMPKLHFDAFHTLQQSSTP